MTSAGAAADAPCAVATGLVEWARRTPDRLAATDGVAAATFAEVDARAGTLARRIREEVDRLGGRRPGSFLPVLVGSDVASVVAVHAAVRSGLPWTPLDRSQPVAALTHLLDRVGRPGVVVTTGPEAVRLPGDPVVLTVPEADAAGDPAAPFPAPADDPGLVVFTSGSTGRPKGVVLTRAMVDRRWSVQILPTGEGVHSACPVPIHWLGGLDWALNLCAGDSVAVLDPRGVDAVALFDWFDAGGFTRLNLVPTQIARMVDRVPPGRRLERVEDALVFGESVPWTAVTALRGRLGPGAGILVTFGATEVLVAPLRTVIGPDDAPGDGWVPLGTERSPGRVRLMPRDGTSRPGEAGDPGEIVVVGDVAAGYLDDPDLTAARFGVDPDGTRWWRSGDLAVVDDGGRYHHRGRVDDLVKIGGRLVEPAEPERVLHAVPGIRRAVVVPHESERGRTRLVAHVEVGDPAPTVAEVRARLEAELSGALVPSPLVRHDLLPQRPNGKVDRFALRSAAVVPWLDPAPTGGPDPDDLVAAVTGLAAGFVDWGTCGPDDDLWHLGLDSLDAVELVAACGALGRGALEPTALLAHRTPRALADCLRRGGSTRADDVVVLNPAGDRPAVVLVPGGGGTAHGYRSLADALGPDQPVLVVEARGLHTPGRVDRTVAGAADHGCEQMADHWPRGTVVLGGHSVGGAIALEVAQRLTDRGRDVHLVVFDAALRGAAGAPRLRRWASRAVRWLPTTVRAHRLGPPTADPARYGVFASIGARAVRRYRPAPVRFPVTVFVPAGSRNADRWRALGPVTVLTTGGAHLTMLGPPFADRIAAVLRGILEGAGPPTGPGNGAGW